MARIKSVKGSWYPAFKIPNLCTQEVLKKTYKKKYNTYAFNITHIIATPVKIHLQ